MDNSLHGSFKTLVGYVCIIALAVFMVAWIIRSMLGDSDLYRALLSLINPYETSESMSGWSTLWHILFACIGSVVFMGVLVSTLVNWVEQRRHRWSNGEARYHVKSPFVIIIGAHPLLNGLVRQVLDDSSDVYVVILSERKASDIREDLSQILNENEISRIVLYTGSIISSQELQLLYPHNATAIYILGDYKASSENDHDSISLQILNTLCDLEIADIQTQIIPTHVLFERNSTFKAFLHTDMAYTLTSAFQFIPYNYYDLWGQTVFGAMLSSKRKLPYPYNPLDGGKGITFEDSTYIHFVATGFDEMVKSLTLQVARLCHFPNYCNKDIGCPRSLITVISKDAKSQAGKFMNLYSAYFKNTLCRVVTAKNLTSENLYRWNKDQEFDADVPTDVAWEFIEASIDNGIVQDYLIQSASNNRSIMTLALCHNAADQIVEDALSLPSSLYKDLNSILVRQDCSESILSSLHRTIGAEKKKSIISNMFPFGMPDANIFTDLTSLRPACLIGFAYNASKDLAERVEYNDVTHENMNHFETVYYDTLRSSISPHESEPNWNKSISPTSGKSFIQQRYSNIYHAISLPYRYRSFRMSPDKDIFFDFNNPMIIAEVEHNRWITEQLIAGFLPSSAEKADNIGFVHPDLCPFDRLSRRSKLVTFAMASVAPFVVKANGMTHLELKSYLNSKQS